MPRSPSSDGRGRAQLGRRAILILIRGYQLTLSALVGRQCRYLPTCSDYAAEAVARHGPWAGGWMAAARLCRCHPLGAWGHDPVPLGCEPVPRSRPWRYGVWRMAASDGAVQDRARSSASRP